MELINHVCSYEFPEPVNYFDKIWYRCTLKVVAKMQHTGYAEQTDVMRK